MNGRTGCRLRKSAQLENFDASANRLSQKLTAYVTSRTIELGTELEEKTDPEQKKWSAVIRRLATLMSSTAHHHY